MLEFFVDEFIWVREWTDLLNKNSIGQQIFPWVIDLINDETIIIWVIKLCNVIHENFTQRYSHKIFSIYLNVSTNSNYDFQLKFHMD